MKYWIHVMVLGASILFANCKDAKQHSDDDRLLAQVYNKSLYLSDMDGMLPIGISSEDSTMIIDKYVRYWVREAAMLYEAEQNVPQGLDIDQLVEDYRASLIKHNYENILVDRLLDSTVTSDELKGFYEKNKEQYQLETPIIRCHFIKIPRSSPQLQQAQAWWDSNQAADFSKLKTWCAAGNAPIYRLNDTEWYNVVDIAAFMPQGTLTVDNVSAKREFIQKDDDFVYFFKALELLSKKEIAPLGFIEEQARKVILHKRKTELLEEMKDKLYDEAMRLKSIEVYQ